MSKFLALCLCLAIAGTAQADLRWLVPSPVSILLTLGAWTKKDRVEVFYVRAQGHGRTESQAREAAFRLAVNQAVGSLLLSHQHVENSEVIRNEIINYSSGHIHDFEILERTENNNGYIVVADVWVRRSLIADRLLNESRDAAQIEGGRIAAQIDSLSHKNRSAAQVLESVLLDFPQRSFDVDVGNTRVVINSNRSHFLIVPVEVRWARGYLTSLAEAVKTVDANPSCSGWFAKCDNKVRIAVAGTVGHFDDNGIYWLFSKHMAESRPALRLRLMDINGSTQYQTCFYLPEIGQSSYAPWYFFDIGGNKAILYDGRAKTFNLQVQLDGLPVRDLDKAQAEFVRSNQCRG